MSGITQALFMAGSAKEISFVNAATAITTSSSISVSKPTNTASGDILVAFLNSSSTSNRTWTMPSGWTEIADQGVSPNIGVAYKVAGGSEPASYTFTHSASEPIGGTIVCYRDAAYDKIGALATPIDTPATVTLPAVTPTFAKSTILAFGAKSADGAYSSNNNSFSLVAQSTLDPTSVVLSKENQGAVSSGTTAITFVNANGDLSGVQVVLKPA